MLRNYWCLRQNDGENMDQNSMYNFIIETSIVVCPWGFSGICKKNISEKLYNETSDLSPEKVSKSQDRKFIEEINIDDIIIIPFLNTNRCIIGKITSETIYDINTNYSIVRSSSGKKLVKYSTDELEKCEPIGRFIEILDSNYIIKDKRCLGRQSLCKTKFIKDNFSEFN
jgi:predicted Mrr-cat superfamily restriction endonuclease